MLALILALGATAGLQAGTTPATPEKLVCRWYPEPSSRVKKTKVCKTRADWEYYDKEAREGARELLDTTRVRGRPGGM
ncbi:hypothetical protein [Sphingomonas sp.]|uniref:hypothetical protein n=1 Tax=Sphingomonas sp. TaxID=28214 RepID=UPI001ED33110|nr:hypothetical protein [Sphingomonas sp.]MBX3593506.1 hypothetical protein [Sphingomonas sp.]